MKILRVIVYVLFLVSSGVLIYTSRSSRLDTEKENYKLSKVIKDKESKINDLESEIEILEDQISEREMEIKFWGMKYDSINNKVK